MRQTIKKRNSRGWRRELVVIALAVALTTIGIKASDYLGGPEALTQELTGPCPAGMVQVLYKDGDFCIDKYEASPGRDCPYDNPGSQRDSQLNLDSPGCSPASAAGKRPWRFISQDQAALACAQAGKRLATPAEWYQAALGTPDAPGNWGEDDCNVNKNWGEGPGLTGTGRDCRSSAGAHDMIGNVWEWVDGVARDGRFEEAQLPPSGYVHSTDGQSLPLLTEEDEPDDMYHRDYYWLKEEGVRSLARGGYWGNESDAGQYSLYIVAQPDFAGTGIGFRCAK